MKKETGLMFKAPLVRAILSGQKTQERRVMANQPAGQTFATVHAREVSGGFHWHSKLGESSVFKCPMGQPGDQIYVRETFAQGYKEDPLTGDINQWDEAGNKIPMTTWYRATDDGITWSDDDGWETNVPWCSSAQMPKALARIWLEVTGVRVERLQSISEEDLASEGIQEHIDGGCDHDGTPRDAFRNLWESTGGDWAANPWVWVIDFKRIEREAQKGQ